MTNNIFAGSDFSKIDTLIRNLNSVVFQVIGYIG